MNSLAENVSIDRVRVNHVPQNTPVIRAKRKSATNVVTVHVVVRFISTALMLLIGRAERLDSAYVSVRFLSLHVQVRIEEL
jgi:hypothetical protein